MILAIFNPEHDLCLSNGSPYFVPPQSALEFARKGAPLMREIYPDSIAVDAAHAGGDFRSNPISRIVPWGWDAVLCKTLERQGIPSDILPSLRQLADIRMLSHRSTSLRLAKMLYRQGLVEYLPLEVRSVDEICAELRHTPEIVLKSPLSGSGRGIRWVSQQLSEHDTRWAEKVLRDHQSLMLELRCKVVQDFAMEFSVDAAETRFLGYSLFRTQSGVYMGNYLWSDSQILAHLSQYIPLESILQAQDAVLSWLDANVRPLYQGPLGVDMFVYREGDAYRLNPAVEINFRHTMGHVALALRLRAQSADGLWSPQK